MFVTWAVIASVIVFAPLAFCVFPTVIFIFLPTATISVVCMVFEIVPVIMFIVFVTYAVFEIVPVFMFMFCVFEIVPAFMFMFCVSKIVSVVTITFVTMFIAFMKETGMVVVGSFTQRV
ncbi:hypothetical protein C2G38_2085630 [Gigaspora rosea]|uniref:Uncharacterized protein n=1 Tax=Gigaspora rosea TaxID=44941 RepID=A0A397V8N9_9GLOM|nr:hypothetical protein C2G38_2085630 [Gigaspora rosea]